jgi:putative endonuclease
MTGEVAQPQTWYLYLLRRADGGLYTGISTDVARRFEQHASGKGARSLRGKALLGIDYSRLIGSRSLATRAEYRAKRLSKREKEALVTAQPELPTLLRLLELAESTP